MQINSTPILKSLEQEYTFVDNELQEGLKQVGLFAILSKHGVNKRCGACIKQLIFAILVSPFLGHRSLHAFLGKFLECFVKSGKDVIYRFLNRQNINWREVSFDVAKAVFQNHQLGNESESAFVVDDTIKQRRGKKVESVSLHFDHTECRSVMGQQVLQFGLATAKGFLPIESQIFIGDKKVQKLNKGFDDKRSSVARDYKRAEEMNKNEMFRSMIKRSLRKGIYSKNVVGDTWYGTKANIHTVVTEGLTGVFMMKRSKLKYRFQNKMYTAKMLYKMVKRRMTRAKKQRFSTYALTVEINTAGKDEAENWLSVKLLFCKAKKSSDKSWGVLLCTDLEYSPEKILRIYALRWSIEVYFKEVKQGMGWLREQSGSYVVHYASINLAAIRYSILYNIMLSSGKLTFGINRDKLTNCLERLCFATVLWELFKALISGALEQLQNKFGEEAIKAIMNAINATVEDFLTKSLQLDDLSVKMQQNAEKMAT